MSLCQARLRVAALTAALVSALAALPGAAAAQSWDWGGGNEVGGSGRQTVRFSPMYKPGAIIVSFADRRLYLVTRPGEAASYPIAIPREQSRWQGAMSITEKRENPSWTPTQIMRAENPRLPTWVPGGHPMNPLGVRALYLGASAYRIHGTDAPWTIGQPVSKGCIRMYNQDAVDLYNRVRVGTHVTVTWQRFGSTSYAEAPAAPAAEQRAAKPRRAIARATADDADDAAAEPRTEKPRRAVTQTNYRRPAKTVRSANAGNATEAASSTVETGALPTE